MKRSAAILALALALFCTSIQAKAPARTLDDEVIYLVFFRSFADSDGDGIGDLNGMTDKLAYIHELGATSILLTPILPSPFYHNYFPSDFTAIDPAYGTMADYRAFLKAAHAKGLKVYLDIEIQYVGEGHPWLTESLANPNAASASHLLWKDRKKSIPEPFLQQPKWESYDGKWHAIAMIDLNNPATRREIENAMMFWADPHGDGSGRDGADGFRIDHMMDDLDNKGLATNLFAQLWKPIFSKLRQLKPDFRIIAEQSDWGYGEQWMADGDADAVFAFPLRGAMLKLNRDEIVKTLRATAEKTPPGKQQIAFLENHDTDRLVSTFNGDARKAQLATAIMLFSPGTPLLYYGEELGMRGLTRKGTLSDGAHVPLREAMRWKADENAKGSASWYRHDARSWSARLNRSRDGVSLEEQQARKNSDYRWHQSMLAMRANRVELRRGELNIKCQKIPDALCLERHLNGQRSILVANLGTKTVPFSTIRNALPKAPGISHWKGSLRPFEFRILRTP